MPKKAVRNFRNFQVSYWVIGVLAVALIVAAILILSQGRIPTSQPSAPLSSSALFGEVKTFNETIRLGSWTFSPGMKYLVHPSQLISGGPPKDGIPAIDNPKFEPASQADAWLPPEAEGLGIVYKDQKRFYPLRILNWHEIINDKFNGERIAVTYCPLCRSGIAFRPDVNGEEVEFGTSGLLWNSDLVMYDRKTDSLWSQITGTAIIGEMTGSQLQSIPTLETARWKDWKSAHPDTVVLSRNTGYSRPYDTSEDIYGIYQPNFIGIGVTFNDTRLQSNAIVYGIAIGNATKAYHQEAIAKVGSLDDIVGGMPIRIVWDSQLNVVKIFKRVGNQTGERITSLGHFWYAWLAVFPNSELYK